MSQYDDMKKEREWLIDHLGHRDVLEKLTEYLENRMSFRNMIKRIFRWWR